MKPLIVVVGATGRQGNSVVGALVKAGQWRVRGISRNISSQTSQNLIKNGVEMVTCNIDSFDECLKAFDGAYGVFAMTNYWECGSSQEYEQGLNMVKAAQQQSVKHFIWSSLPDTLAISHGLLDLPHYMSKSRVESYIRAQQQQDPPVFLYTTFIYVGFYYQNFHTSFKPTSDFEFRVPLKPTTRLPLYDVRDTGPIVLECFAHPDRWGHEQVVPCVGQQFTMEQICETIRQVTGKKQIKYVPLSYDECVGQIKEYTDTLRWYNEYGDVDERQEEKTRKVHDNMRTLTDWIKETGWLMG